MTTPNKNEEDVLSFILGWMDSHVDENGIRQPPARNTVSARGYSAAALPGLYKKGYLRIKGSQTIIPTPRAEAWWIRRKRGRDV